VWTHRAQRRSPRWRLDSQGRCLAPSGGLSREKGQPPLARETMCSSGCTEVADDDFAEAEDPAASNALDGPAGDKHGHALARAAEGGADRKDHDGRNEDGPPTKDLSEAARPGQEGDRGETIYGSGSDSRLSARRVRGLGGAKARRKRTGRAAERARSKGRQSEGKGLWRKGTDD
jgi:hypothetical protein